MTPQDAYAALTAKGMTPEQIKGALNMIPDEALEQGDETMPPMPPKDEKPKADMPPESELLPPKPEGAPEGEAAPGSEAAPDELAEFAKDVGAELEVAAEMWALAQKMPQFKSMAMAQAGKLIGKNYMLRQKLMESAAQAKSNAIGMDNLG